MISARLRRATLRASLLCGLLCLAPLASPAGCGGCQGKAPLAFVPVDAFAVIELPSLRKALVANASFFKRIAKGPLLASPTAVLADKLGLDLTDSKSFRDKGLDPAAGLVASVTVEGDDAILTLVLPTQDERALDKYLRQQLTRHSSGTIAFSDQMEGGIKVTLADDRLGWTFQRKHLIAAIALQPAATKHGRALSKRLLATATSSKSIEQNATFTRARAALGRFDALFYLDGAAARRRLKERAAHRARGTSGPYRDRLEDERELGEGLLSYADGLSIAWQAEHDRVSLKGLLSVPEGRRGILKRILSGEGDAAPLARYIAADALLVTRLTVHPKRLFDHTLQLLAPRQKRSLYRAIERWEQSNNLSLEKDVLGSFAGRYAAALFPPPTGAAATDPQQALTKLGVIGLAQLASPEKGRRLLDRLERYLVVNGHEVRARSVGQRKVFELSKGTEPVLSWSLVGETLVVSTPQRLEQTVTLIEKGGASVREKIGSRRAKRLLGSDDGQAIYHDFATLKSSVDRLDLPIPLRLVLTPALGALGELRDLTLGAEVASEGLRADLILRLR